MQTITNTLPTIDLIFSAIDELNQRLTPDRQLDKDINTILFGESGQLKSLELVNLILIIEEKLEEEFDLLISLTDERAMSQKRSPFRTVARLADYINLLLKDLVHD